MENNEQGQFDYFKDAKIDNPLNIKRIDGDIPTAKGGPKNIIILVVVGAILSLSFNKVFAIVEALTDSVAMTAFIVGVSYLFIAFWTAHFTVLEGKKQEKAYKDLLDNRLNDLSAIWEVQDIRENVEFGTPIGYMDMIDGTRTVLLKCVPGPIVNQEVGKERIHYSTIEKVTKDLTDLKLQWDLHVVEEPSDEQAALNFFYDSLKDYKDPNFTDVFTEILDTIDYTVTMGSSLHVVYIEINAIGQHKHNLLKSISGLPIKMKKGTAFKEVRFLTKSEFDRWISHDNSVGNFDREELIMRKYRNSFNLGVTSVLAAFDNTGKMVRKFQEDFDPRKIVRKRSIDLNPKKALSQQPKMQRKVVESQELTQSPIPKLGSSDDKLLELMYSNDKVKLG